MSSDPDREIVSLYAEQLQVDKMAVETDRLRISTTVEERPVTIATTIERGGLTIERIPVNRSVADAPPPRQEGDVLVVSVVEERLVVEKRLFVIEEIRVTTTTTIERIDVSDTVRRMHAEVERHAPTPQTEETAIAE